MIEEETHSGDQASQATSTGEREGQRENKAVKTKKEREKKETMTIEKIKHRLSSCPPAASISESLHRLRHLHAKQLKCIPLY